MVAKKRLYDIRLIGLVAPLHHRRIGLWRIDFALLDGERREGERRRAFKVPRHEKSSGRQRRKMIIPCTARAKISGKGFGLPARPLLACFGARIGVSRKSPPLRGKRCARS